MSDLEIVLAKAVSVARQFGATRLILFGSALTNPATARDLDLACAGVPGWKLFELAAALEDALRVPMDLVPLDSWVGMRQKAACVLAEDLWRRGWTEAGLGRRA